jgi:hypothetical protein
MTKNIDGVWSCFVPLLFSSLGIQKRKTPEIFLFQLFGGNIENDLFSPWIRR